MIHRRIGKSAQFFKNNLPLLRDHGVPIIAGDIILSFMHEFINITLPAEYLIILVNDCFVLANLSACGR